MFFAAQLLALTVKVACFLGTEPGVTNEARNSVLFDAESWHGKRMDDVVGGGNYTHFLAHRHHQWVIHLKQIVVAFGLARVRHRTLSGVQGGDVAQALAFTFDVVITPFPLVASGLDGQIRVGGVFLGHQHFGGRQSHQDHDQKGHSSPNDLNRDRFGESGGLVTHRLAVLPDRIKHDRENGNEDHCTEDQHEPMQPVLLFSDFGRWRCEIELIDRRAARQIIDRMSSRGQPCTCKNARAG